MVARVAAVQEAAVFEIGEPFRAILRCRGRSSAGLEQLIDGVPLAGLAITDLGQRAGRERPAVRRKKIMTRRRAADITTAHRGVERSAILSKVPLSLSRNSLENHEFGCLGRKWMNRGLVVVSSHSLNRFTSRTPSSPLLSLMSETS